MNCKSYFGLCTVIAGLMSIYSLSLHSQGMTLSGVRFLTAAPTFESPAEELGLLPDTSSYYIIEELFNADTLTRRGTQLTYYNYGDIRYVIRGDLNTNSYSDNIVLLQRINDTFSIQTSSDFHRDGLYVDSTLVWWKEGRIVRASEIRSNKIRIDYTYAYKNGKLVRRTQENANHGKTEINYIYTDGKLTKIIYHDPSEDEETTFQYSDTLITTTSVSKSGWHVNTATRLDEVGRKKSLRIYTQSPEDREGMLYQSEDYIYFHDGGCQMTATQTDPDFISIREFHPGYFATERWTWEGIDQVLVRRWGRM